MQEEKSTDTGDVPISHGAADWGERLEEFRAYLQLHARLGMGTQLRGKADPADLVQETFLQAHRYRSEFRGTSRDDLMKWLRSILVSRLVKLKRRFLGTKARDLRLERRLEAELAKSSARLDRALFSDSSSVTRRLSREERALYFANALAKLPDHYREVILLRHVEQFTFAKVAREMSRSVDSVTKIWTRAILRLQKSLGENLP
jgi:RNA polymerase sigma-70 factor (ECF subfamily)